MAGGSSDIRSGNYYYEENTSYTSNIFVLIYIYRRIGIFLK
jgi:hypothetical protein